VSRQQIRNRTAVPIDRVRAALYLAVTIDDEAAVDDGNHQHLSIAGLTKRRALASVLRDIQAVVLHRETPRAACAQRKPSGPRPLQGGLPQFLVWRHKIEAPVAEIENDGAGNQGNAPFETLLIGGIAGTTSGLVD
jgi:hypothetical protein